MQYIKQARSSPPAVLGSSGGNDGGNGGAAIAKGQLKLRNLVKKKQTTKIKIKLLKCPVSEPFLDITFHLDPLQKRKSRLGRYLHIRARALQVACIYQRTIIEIRIFHVL